MKIEEHGKRKSGRTHARTEHLMIPHSRRV